MLRASVASMVGVLAATALLGAQNHPGFAGSWTLVPAASPTQSEWGAFGPSLVISQTENAITLEGRSQRVEGGYSPGVGSSPLLFTPGPYWHAAYLMDGREHAIEMQTAEALSATPLFRSVASNGDTYRATWTGDRLVIMVYGSRTATLPDRSTSTFKRTVRHALTLDQDGALIADSLIIADPRPGSIRQEAPMPARSTYRRTR